MRKKLTQMFVEGNGQFIYLFLKCAWKIYRQISFGQIVTEQNSKEKKKKEKMYN